LDSKILEKARTSGKSHPDRFFDLPRLFAAHPWHWKLRTTEFNYAARWGRNHPRNQPVKISGFLSFPDRHNFFLQFVVGSHGII
jgi:hypothetical protein